MSPLTLLLALWLLTAIVAALGWGAFVHAGRGGADDASEAEGADRNGTQAAGAHGAGMAAPSPATSVCVMQIRCGQDTV